MFSICFHSLIYSFLIVLFKLHLILYSFYEYEYATYFTESEQNASYDYIIGKEHILLIILKSKFSNRKYFIYSRFSWMWHCWIIDR